MSSTSNVFSVDTSSQPSVDYSDHLKCYWSKRNPRTEYEVWLSGEVIMRKIKAKEIQRLIDGY